VQGLENQAKSAEKTYNEFLMETRCALLFEKSMSKEFAHSVEVEKGHLKFAWKLVLDHGIKFQLGTAMLLENENKDIGSFLDSVICQFSKMKDEISTLSTAKENLLNEREKTLKRLEEFASAKEQLEVDLYEKFLSVLNEKKAKIRQLKKACENLRDEQAQSVVGDASAKPKAKSSHESSEEDEDTDKEEEKRAENNRKQTTAHKMPKIIGADEEEDEEVTIPARRKKMTRQKRNSRAAVLPRTASLPRPLSKRTSSGADSSASLNQSSENLEKLVDNM